jgi:hypothetical protein
MEASLSQAQELPAWFTDCDLEPECPLPPRFKELPFEIQDHILRYVVCSFATPETSDPENNGIYIRTDQDLAEMEWGIDTRLLEHPDERVRKRATRLMLVENKLVHIRSESLNLLPIFHAAQVPIVTMARGRWDRSGVDALSRYFHITHQIELEDGWIEYTEKPWGHTQEFLRQRHLVGTGAPKITEYVILGRDLAHFCRALNGANSGYVLFAQFTWHTITFHGPATDMLGENIAILDPSIMLKPYREILRDFENFTVMGRVEHDLANTIEEDVGRPFEKPQPHEIAEFLRREVGRGQDKLRAHQPLEAAHTFARAAQVLVMLDSKGVEPLESPDVTPAPVLANIYFKLQHRLAAAWLCALRHVAADDLITTYAGGWRRSKSVQLTELRDLVYAATSDLPWFLEYTPSNSEESFLLYHRVKADRLSGIGDRNMVLVIEQARFLNPQSTRISREQIKVLEYIRDPRRQSRAQLRPR